jgi:hypothetical protein
MSRRAAFVALLLVVAIVPSCGGDTAAGGAADGEIQTALPMEQNGLLDDRIDADDDPEDWKFLQVDVQDDVFLLFFFDNPKIEAEVGLYTGAGNRVASTRHDAQNEFDLLQAPSLAEGRYYVKIEAASGSSVYTVRSATGQMPLLGGSEGSTEPRPE